jgi:hypothetical protein
MPKMRHKDGKLTEMIYADENLLGLEKAAELINCRHSRNQHHKEYHNSR